MNDPQGQASSQLSLVKGVLSSISKTRTGVQKKGKREKAIWTLVK